MKKSLLSPQRALIALQSFDSIAAAARSVGVSHHVLKRLTLDDQEIAQAYTACSQRTERRKKEQTPLSVRVVALGRNPPDYDMQSRLAAGALGLREASRRLNTRKRKVYNAQINKAVASVDAMISDNTTRTPFKQVLVDGDRWCANCKDHRTYDPCEVCDRHTLRL